MTVVVGHDIIFLSFEKGMKPMKALLGSVEHQLDAKNRIRIPAKFREIFKTEYEHQPLYFVMYNPNRIAIMPESVLNLRMSVFDNIMPDDEEAMDAVSKILGSVEEVALDGQDRAMLPKKFREDAKIKKDVITVGMGNYIEVWAKEVREDKITPMTLSQANAIAYARARENKS